MTRVYLAHSPGAQGDNNLVGRFGVEPLPPGSWPCLLISYEYIDLWLKMRHRYRYRYWIMDSGAYSVHNKGATIDIRRYADDAAELWHNDPTLAEVISLDVIGGKDWETTIRNTEYLWEHGVPAWPTYHYDEPIEFLDYLKEHYPAKIGFGGVAGLKSGAEKIRQARETFERVWPMRIHGLSYSGYRASRVLPFHSVDATNWEKGPCKFGNWKAYGGQQLSIRGSKQNLHAEIDLYLRMEREAEWRWRRELKRLEDELPPWPPQDPEYRKELVSHEETHRSHASS